jgi:hypothetical protein
MGRLVRTDAARRRHCGYGTIPLDHDPPIVIDQFPMT